MVYKIIITKDGKKKKILYEGSNEDTAKEKYFNTKDKNKVLFPKKNNAYKKVKPVHYEIMFLKEREESDTPFYVRDELGRTTPVNINSDKWSLVHKDDYYYEEKFTVFGYDQRMETKEIIKKILLRRNKQDKIKQVN
jgi:PAB1-binding protein PBP1